MGNYKVSEPEYKTPPQDSYFLDLIWISQVDGSKGPYYRWWWGIADIETQKEWVGCVASSQTSLNPTLNNRFGEFLKVILGGIEVDSIGSTEDLVKNKYRVKGFLKHNKPADKVYCNVDTLIEGTAKKGEGCGYKGAPEFLKEEINVFLKAKGVPLLEIKEKKATSPKQESASAPKKQEIPW